MDANSTCKKIMDLYICIKHTYHQCLIIKISHPAIVGLVSVCERPRDSMLGKKQLSWKVQEQHSLQPTEIVFTGRSVNICLHRQPWSWVLSKRREVAKQGLSGKCTRCFSCAYTAHFGTDGTSGACKGPASTCGISQNGIKPSSGASVPWEQQGQL